MLRARKRWRLPGTSERIVPDSTDESTIVVDVVCNLSDIHTITKEETRILLFDAQIVDFRAIGEVKQHLKLTILQDQVTMDCIGYDLGFLIPDITPNAQVNIVAQPMLREWNGNYKIQLIIEDLEIPDMQIFDYRETKDKAAKLQFCASADSMIVCFREESILEIKDSKLQLNAAICYVDENLISTMVQFSNSSLYSELIVYDTPYSITQFNYGLTIVPKPERIYCLFGDEYKDRLAVLPKRDLFKWLYSVFLTHKRINTSALPQLAKAGKVSEQTILFMLSVFIDLGFVLDENGTYSILPSPTHRDIQESKHFQRKRAEMQLETEILYSSYGILCNAIKEVTL